MAKFRYVNTGIWDDDWFVNLDPLEQHLFLYLLLNGATNMSGIYQIPLRRIAFDTGIDSEKIKKMLARFEADKRVYYELGYVIMKNWLRHQVPNTKQWVAVINTINALPEWLRQRIHDPKDTLYIPYESLSNGIIRYGTKEFNLIKTLTLNKTLTSTEGPKPGKPGEREPNGRGAGGAGGGMVDLTIPKDQRGGGL